MDTLLRIEYLRKVGESTMWRPAEYFRDGVIYIDGKYETFYTPIDTLDLEHHNITQAILGKESDIVEILPMQPLVKLPLNCCDINKIAFAGYKQINVITLNEIMQYINNHDVIQYRYLKKDILEEDSVPQNINNSDFIEANMPELILKLKDLLIKKFQEFQYCSDGDLNGIRVIVGFK
jgi:hypothetical protein